MSAAFETTPETSSRALLLAVLLAAVSAVAGALLMASHPQQGWQWLHWIGKPLTTALIFVLAWRAQPAQSSRYRRRILAGIVCSLAGDVLLMLPGDRFVPGLLAFLCAHLCFIRAFADDCRLGARPAWLLVALGVGALNLFLLWDWISVPLRIPVIVYVVVLASMAGQALVRAQAFAQHGDLRAVPARLAAVGALVFMFSDSVLAWDRFRGPLPLASLWVLSAYYLAMGLIARSVQCAGSVGKAGTAR
ncbi:lysoplasmalogenase [Rhodanobacter sp. AS-Z3]|uniref:lysoplasmalogenase n=1 Tax=Rhodanobacter sp. AS-Z3 TaxID=3031330 RepID=UPI002478EBF0|nr:lysoplasmalogenase [Rhodanobacter sp. AS-Z3]WEN15801.1 lysoplasmalogenase [Rhodanobacter sp. AS-Z3]